MCELVGLYILPILQEKLCNPNFGLYRDDGLGALHNLNAQDLDRKRKDITEIFKKLGLKITIETNLKAVNFLDVTFDLRNESYKPYRKPNDNPLYINASSNHPPSIIKQLPKNISKRISEISSSKEIFDEAAPYYNNALKASGYKKRITYQPPETAAEQKTQSRKRKVIWFNPPYSMNVKTNIARKFLQLLDNHFPTDHHLHKVFNRNNVKVSYSCMPNTSNTIKSHNKRILQDQHTTTTAECNCRKRETCPLKGECQTENVVYVAKVSNNANNEEKSYIGLTERTFKDRLYKHRNSLRHHAKANATELSKYVWDLKDRNIEEINIEWSIFNKAPTLRNGSKTCSLCLSEKFHIIYHNKENLLNKRSEILSTCRHRNKFLLSNFKESPPDN